MIMKLKILLLVFKITILSDSGGATRMHLHPPPHLYPIQFFTMKQNELVSKIKSANDFWEVKEVPTISNRKTTFSTEKLISHHKSLDMTEEETDILQHMFTENHNTPSALGQNLSNLLPQISKNVQKKIIAVLVQKENNKANIETMTNKVFNLVNTTEIKIIDFQLKERKNINTTRKDSIITTGNTTLQFPDTNEEGLSKQETVSLPNPLVKNYSENIVYSKSNQNIDENVFSNRSEVSGNKESCDGKYSQHVYSLETVSGRLEEDFMKEEDKLNDKLYNKTLDFSWMYGNFQDIIKQRSNFLKIKLLVLNHLQSLHTKPISGVNVSNISIQEVLSQSQNIYELVENLNKIFKQIKKDVDDPTGFVKMIVENQIEKCNEMYNKSVIDYAHNKTWAKIESNKTIMKFMMCVNMNLKVCLKNFILWLATRKFYLRPLLKISKAYKNYERIYSLSCI